MAKSQPRCSVCGREIDPGDGLPGEMVRGSIADLIRRDRLRAEHDHRISLKAELEIRLLSARFDQLRGRQWSRLAEIQQIQMDLMEEIGSHRRMVEAAPSRPEAT